MRERKTDRVYGAVVKEIRRVARLGLPFTISDINGGIERRRMLSTLVKKGELRRVRPGKSGGPQTIYKLAKSST